jgi:hypothetical protein
VLIGLTQFSFDKNQFSPSIGRDQSSFRLPAQYHWFLQLKFKTDYSIVFYNKINVENSLFYKNGFLRKSAKTHTKQTNVQTSINFESTVKRPKFGNGPLVRHPLSKFLKNHISAWAEVSDLVQRGERL